MSDTTNKDRRHFLFSVSGAAVAAAGGSIVVQGCGTGMMPMGDSGTSFTATGLTVGGVMMGAVTPVSSAGVVIGRDAGGFYALDMTCTHQACLVGPNMTSMVIGPLYCACHNSQYSATGEVVRMADGASTQSPLPMFPVHFTGTGSSASITVDKNTMVTDRTMRFTPPA